jgi:hypothetical protein
MAGEAIEEVIADNDKTPIMAGGTDDIKEIAKTNDTYVGETILAGEVIENVIVDRDKTPIMAGGTNDIGKIHKTNDAYIEDTPFAQWNSDKPGVTVDYSKMSYVEQHHIFGANGNSQKVIYNELLEIVQAAGIISYIEMIIKDSD